MIQVEGLTQVWDAFKWFKDSGMAEILHIEDNLSGDTKDIKIQFNFDDKLLGVLAIRYEPLHPCYQAN